MSDIQECKCADWPECEGIDCPRIFGSQVNKEPEKELKLCPFCGGNESRRSWGWAVCYEWDILMAEEDWERRV